VLRGADVRPGRRDGPSQIEKLGILPMFARQVPELGDDAARHSGIGETVANHAEQPGGSKMIPQEECSPGKDRVGRIRSRIIESAASITTPSAAKGGCKPSVPCLQPPSLHRQCSSNWLLVSGVALY
jgi:hypothetical protein